jgi:hypothetical protein
MPPSVRIRIVMVNSAVCVPFVMHHPPAGVTIRAGGDVDSSTPEDGIAVTAGAVICSAAVGRVYM